MPTAQAPDFLSRVVGFFLKLMLGIFAAVFVVSLLLAALVVAVLSLITALLTGKKPAPTVVFSRFQKYSPGGMWPGARPRDSNAKVPGAKDVVDVEVREIRRDQ